MPAVSPISGERRGTLPGCWKNELSLVVCSYWISYITKIKHDQIYYCTDLSRPQLIGRFSLFTDYRDLSAAKLQPTPAADLRPPDRCAIWSHA